MMNSILDGEIGARTGFLGLVGNVSWKISTPSVETVSVKQEKKKKLRINKMDEAQKTLSFVCFFVSFLGKGGTNNYQ